MLASSILAAPAPAASQPPRGPSRDAARPPETTTIPPEPALEDLRRAYQSEPVADELTITLRSAQGRETTERIVVRIDPGAAAAERPARVRIELGSLIVAVNGKTLAAVRPALDDLYFAAELTAPASPATLAAVLPPLPIPQLAAGSMPGLEALPLAAPTPYTTAVRWTAAAVDERSRPPVVRLSGTSPAGDAEITTDLRTGRLLRFKSAIITPDGPAQLDIVCKPVAPGDPATWMPDVRTRRPVASLRELRARPDPPPPPTGGG